MNKRFSLFVLGVFSLSVAAQNATTVNGKAIPSYIVDFVIRQQDSQVQSQDTSELRKQITDELIKRVIMTQEAERLGLAEQSDVKTQLELSRQNVLIRTLLNDYRTKNSVTDDEYKAEYDKYLATLKSEYRASHILVKTEAEAKKVLAALKKKQKFETLAKKQSIDKGSAVKGGALDWAVAATYVKPFADALQDLKPGETTSVPVQTQFGYHIIRLEEVRDQQPKSLDELKQQFEGVILDGKLRAYQEELRAKAKVE